MDELTTPFLGKERVEMQYPFGSLLRSGARLAGGSDWSVTTANPLEEIEVMVNRVGRASRTRQLSCLRSGYRWPTPLAAFTSGTAYINHDDQDAGRLAPGMRADLAVSTATSSPEGADRRRLGRDDRCVGRSSVYERRDGQTSDTRSRLGRERLPIGARVWLTEPVEHELTVRRLRGHHDTIE